MRSLENVQAQLTIQGKIQTFSVKPQPSKSVRFLKNYSIFLAKVLMPQTEKKRSRH